MEAQKAQQFFFSTSLEGSNPILERQMKHISSKQPSRWRPSELEIVFLEAYLEKNRDPSKQEMRHIVKVLNENFDTNVHPIQLEQWLNIEREKAFNSETKANAKSTYKKFSPEQLGLLNTNFDKDNYPSLQKMNEIAELFKVSLSKIENWYKHTRRTLAKKGQFELKTKKKFKKDELFYLTQVYESDSHPEKAQLNKIANDLKCDFYQIKNWFSNKRKTLRNLSKKPFPISETITTHHLQELDNQFNHPRSIRISHILPQFNESHINSLNLSESNMNLQITDNLNNFVPIFPHYSGALADQMNNSIQTPLETEKLSLTRSQNALILSTSNPNLSTPSLRTHPLSEIDSLRSYNFFHQIPKQSLQQLPMSHSILFPITTPVNSTFENPRDHHISASLSVPIIPATQFAIVNSNVNANPWPLQNFIPAQILMFPLNYPNQSQSKVPTPTSQMLNSK